MKISLTEFQRNFRKAGEAADNGDAVIVMEFADACAVVPARAYEHALVLTTDFRNFSTYGVSSAWPEGAFHT